MHSHAIVAAALLSLNAVASAQCATWTGGFEPPGPVLAGGPLVRALVAFDDGSQSRLVAGGAFAQVAALPAANIIGWDGSQWSTFGAGLDGQVRALAVFDDGAGPRLYAAGEFTHSGATSANRVAWWDGANWNPLGAGVNGAAHALAVYDDGAGPALYVAGAFTSAGGISSPRIARWKNGAWGSIGSPGGGVLQALTVYDFGGDQRLYASGAQVVGAWDGASWSTLASRFTGQAVALQGFDDGTGPALYASGTFAEIDGVLMLGFARWNGAQWQSVPNSPGVPGLALTVFDDGGGPGLLFGSGSQPAAVKRWRNGAWSDVGSFASQNSAASIVRCFARFDDGQFDTLYVGGSLAGSGDTALWSIARLDAGAWSSVITDGQGLEAPTRALEFGDLGDGPRLFAAGDFRKAGGAAAQYVAQYDGSRWHVLGQGLNQPAKTLEMHDDGSGETLYAGGVNLFADQTRDAVGRWNGTDWELVPGLLGTSFQPGGVRDLASFEVAGQPRLYACGDIVNTQAQAGEPSQGHLAWWNGTRWQIVPTHTYGGVYSLEVLDFGGARALYAAGFFTSIDGVDARQIARFDGVQWSPVGPSLGLPPDSSLNALAVHDDGSGPALYAAGTRKFAINSLERIVVKFDGSTWSDIGAWPDFSVHSLATFDDGFGPGLFASGSDSSFAPASGLRVWRNGAWTNVAGAVTDGASDWMGSLLAAPDANSPHGALWVGGQFTRLGSLESRYIARYANECACDATAYCTSGVTSSGCVPTIQGVGRASATLATAFSIELTRLEGARSGHVFYGVNGPHASTWGSSSHFLCVKAPTQRTPTQATGGAAGTCEGTMAFDWNGHVAANPATLGAPFLAGDMVWAQAYFRDPAGAKTTALSNALRFAICP